jgi:hypothetical protein
LSWVLSDKISIERERERERERGRERERERERGRERETDRERERERQRERERGSEEPGKWGRDEDPTLNNWNVLSLALGEGQEEWLQVPRDVCGEHDGFLIEEILSSLRRVRGERGRRRQNRCEYEGQGDASLRVTGLRDRGGGYDGWGLVKEGLVCEELESGRHQRGAELIALLPPKQALRGEAVRRDRGEANERRRQGKGSLPSADRWWISGSLRHRKSKAGVGAGVGERGRVAGEEEGNWKAERSEEVGE